MRWTIHTGPFPFIAPQHDGEMWLWRITDGSHFTAVVVKFSAALLATDATGLGDDVAEVRRTRGRREVERCLRWQEPPREIAFEEAGEPPRYWGGIPPAGAARPAGR